MRALYGAIAEILLPVDDNDIDLTAYFSRQRQYIEQIIEDHRREMRLVKILFVSTILLLVVSLSCL